MFGWIGAAIAADGACPAGSKNLVYCTGNGTFTQLCTGPDPSAPTRLFLVAGKIGGKAEVFPKDGDPAAFASRSVEADGEGEQHLELVVGDRSWHVDRWWSMIPGPVGRGTSVTSSRGGKWTATHTCSTFAEIVLPTTLRSVPTLAEPPEPPKVVSLCAADQRTLLVCGIDTKVLSVCTPGVVSDGLQYRFGPPGAPELVYPEVPSLAAFTREGEVSGSGHNVWSELTFERGGFSYTLSSSEPETGNGDPSSAGVRVNKDGKAVASLVCTHGLSSSLPRELLELP